MEALHFFGLSDVTSSTPSTPTMFDSFSDETPNLKKRQRHFSLEDYNAMDESEDSASSSSNLSVSTTAAANVGSKRVRQNSIFFSADDSAVSFGSDDISFGFGSSRRSSELFSVSDLFSGPPPSTTMSLELDNDHIAHQLRAELEIRLLETLCPTPGSGIRRKFSFELPPQLLSIIASHVIQEAANEPYGLKGEAHFSSLWAKGCKTNLAISNQPSSSHYPPRPKYLELIRWNIDLQEWLKLVTDLIGPIPAWSQILLYDILIGLVPDVVSKKPTDRVSQVENKFF